MKKYITYQTHFLIIFSITLFTGCSEDDDNIVNTYGDNVSNITFILAEGSFQSNGMQAYGLH